MLKGETNGAGTAAVQVQEGNLPAAEACQTAAHKRNTAHVSLRRNRVVAQTATLAVAIALAVVAACVWTPHVLPVPGGPCDVTAVHDQLMTALVEPRYCASSEAYYYCDCKACSLHQACRGGRRMQDLLDCACPDGTFYSTPHWGMLAVVGLLTPVSTVLMYVGARRWFDRVLGRWRGQGVSTAQPACDADTKCNVMGALGATALSWILASSFSYESPEASTYMLAAATQVFGVGVLLPVACALNVSCWKSHSAPVRVMEGSLG